MSHSLCQCLLGEFLLGGSINNGTQTINSGLTRWRVAVLINKWTPPRKSGGTPEVNTRFSLSMEMGRLTRDGTAEPVSRDQILSLERGQGNINFSCPADHKQDWQPYPVDPSLALCDLETTYSG